MRRRTRDFRAWLVEAISCYDTSAELFMVKCEGYRRFATAAEAIRFAVEDFPAIRTLRAWTQVALRLRRHPAPVRE